MKWLPQPYLANFFTAHILMTLPLKGSISLVRPPHYLGHYRMRFHCYQYHMISYDITGGPIPEGYRENVPVSLSGEDYAISGM